MTNIRKWTSVAIAVAMFLLAFSRRPSPLPCSRSPVAFADIHCTGPARRDAGDHQAGDVVDFKLLRLRWSIRRRCGSRSNLPTARSLFPAIFPGRGRRRKMRNSSFSCRACSATGTGKIQAWLTVSPGGPSHCRRMTQYLLVTGGTKEDQIEALKKMNAIHPARKDSKAGRSWNTKNAR